MREFIHLYNKVLTTLLLLTVLLAAHSVNAQVAFTGSGSGTTESPYEITNEAQLKEIANNLPAHYKLMNDITLEEAWTPIGVSGSTVSNFTGSLDGVGYKVSGLEIESNTNAGLFAYSVGTIKNLGVEITGEGIKGNKFGGGLVGQNEGTISNCYVTGTSIYVEGTSGGNYAGGIAGVNEKNILNCYSSVDKITVNRTGGSGEKYVGGIVGRNLNAWTTSGCLAINGELIFQNNGQPVYNGYNGAIGNKSEGIDKHENNFAWYKTKLGVTSYTGTNSGTPWDGTAPNNEAWGISDDNLVLYKEGTNDVMITIPISSYKYLEGEGSESDPYLIKSDADLRKLSDYTNNSKNSCTGTFYKLANNIEMNKEEAFTPINNKTFHFDVFSFRRPFSGTFDGNGKIISNLYINSPEAYNGLFGTVEGCTIKNLGLKACDINITFEGKAVVSIGAIVGADYTISQAITKPSVVENCFATGSVKMLGKVDNDGGGGTGCVMGGIVGISSLVNVLNCYTDLSLTDQGSGTATYNSMGGIVGRVDVNAKAEDDLVKNCYVLGNITTTQQIGVSIGGIVGFPCMNKKVSNNLVLCNKIEKTNQTSDSWRVVAGRGKESNITDNYVLEQMVLINKGGIQTVTLEPAFHGTNWDKKTLPSASDWTIENGYLNLNSIKTAFGNDKQIKLADYDPYAITVDENLTNGKITTDPSEAYAGDTVKLAITPDWGYRLKSDTVKVTGAVTDTVKFDMTDSSFVMPSQAVTISAEFILDSLRLADITDGDSLLILQKNAAWFYQIKNTETTKSLPLDTDIPFNGIISGTLTDTKAIAIEPSCKGELTFDKVKVTNLVIKEGVSLVLDKESALTYTSIDNKGGNLVAREGADITNTVTGQVKMNKLTIATPQNGTLAVRVGNTVIASGDMLAVDTKFSVTATPASGYETENLSVKTATADVTAVSGLYTMPDAEVTVSATFKSTYVPPVPTVYYTVTLPTVEGATTNPQAGSYQVEEGYNFSFSLKLEAGYGHSVPVVTANGTVLTPRPNDDSKYIIYNITADTEILISGIVPDAPTSNAEIKSDAIRIRSTAGTLLISTPMSSSLEIYTTSGSRIHQSNLPAGDSQIQLSEGLYIIKVGKHSQKVFIR